MEDLEKKIEEAAENFSVIKRGQIDSFIEGAKSPKAKEYWFAVFEAEKSETEKRLDEYVRNNFDGKPSYSEEEVGELLEQAIGAFQSITRNRTSWSFDIREWFEQNKKK